MTFDVWKDHNDISTRTRYPVEQVNEELVRNNLQYFACFNYGELFGINESLARKYFTEEVRAKFTLRNWASFVTVAGDALIEEFVPVEVFTELEHSGIWWTNVSNYAPKSFEKYFTAKVLQGFEAEDWFHFLLCNRHRKYDTVALIDALSADEWKVVLEDEDHDLWDRELVEALRERGVI